jgi:hypothetical protein
MAGLGGRPGHSRLLQRVDHRGPTPHRGPGTTGAPVPVGRPPTALVGEEVAVLQGPSQPCCAAHRVARCGARSSRPSCHSTRRGRPARRLRGHRQGRGRPWCRGGRPAGAQPVLQRHHEVLAAEVEAEGGAGRHQQLVAHVGEAQRGQPRHLPLAGLPVEL